MIVWIVTIATKYKTFIKSIYFVSNKICEFICHPYSSLMSAKTQTRRNALYFVCSISQSTLFKLYRNGSSWVEPVKD